MPIYFWPIKVFNPRPQGEGTIFKGGGTMAWFVFIIRGEVVGGGKNWYGVLPVPKQEPGHLCGGPRPDGVLK
jgi:hypothetical protein